MSTSRTTAGTSESPVRILALGVLLLAGAVTACSTTRPGASAGSTSQSSILAASNADAVMKSWSSFRNVWFVLNRTNLDASETRKIGEIVRYLELNPAAEVGIDSSVDAIHAEPEDRATNTSRIGTIRDALINDGVPESRIKVGSFSDDNPAFERRVAVLVRTSQ